jgi:hypothetical protein
VALCEGRESFASFHSPPFPEYRGFKTERSLLLEKENLNQPLNTMTHLHVSGLYYKSMTIVNDDSGVVNKLEDSLTVDSRVVIYYRHMSIVQATYFAGIFELYFSCK